MHSVHCTHAATLRLLSAGAVSPQPPVYNEFHSASLYTRLASAPGFLFSFDPSNASALGAAREDVGSVSKLSMCPFTQHVPLL